MARAGRHEFTMDDRPGLTEICASATDSCPGHERCLNERFRIVVKEVDDVVDQFLGQIHLDGGNGSLVTRNRVTRGAARHWRRAKTRILFECPPWTRADFIHSRSVSVPFQSI